MKKWISLILACLMVLALSGCSGNTPPETPAQPETETAQEPEQTQQETETPQPEEQEPERSGNGADFLGIWESDRVTVELCPREEGGWRALVSWGGSATEHTSWEYLCQAEGDALVCTGSGTKTELVWSEDGEPESDTVVYSDGTARFSLNGEGQLLWQDEKENAGEGLVFSHVETPVPAPEELVENYFHTIGGYEPGVAGSSISEALSAYAAVQYAAGNALWAADVPTLRENLLAAWESMSEEEHGYFDNNFMDVVVLIDNCRADWAANRGVFEDGGVAEEMEALLQDETAMASWSSLRNFTLTMGNSDGE